MIRVRVGDDHPRGTTRDGGRQGFEMLAVPDTRVE
jgi:hypothetical protein